MYLLGLKLAELRGTLPAERRAELIADLKRIPHCIEELLEQHRRPGRREIADAHWDKDFFLYLGRHVGLPVALEGALKLKEISYISTDAYAAGEMKHGPIALLDESTPVVTVATDSPVLEKVVSNMQEVRARGAHVVAIATEGNQAIGEHAESVVRIPQTDWMLQPLLAVIPLQLLAYRIARRRGLNVDQPRNLAKTVTVEYLRGASAAARRRRQHVPAARAEQARLGLHAAGSRAAGPRASPGSSSQRVERVRPAAAPTAPSTATSAVSVEARPPRPRARARRGDGSRRW